MFYDTKAPTPGDVAGVMDPTLLGQIGNQGRRRVSNRGHRKGGEESERQGNQAPIGTTGNRARLEPSKRDASRQAHPSVLGFTDRQSSRDSRGIAISWPRIPPASCSNHGRDVARLLSRRDHRASACGGSAMSPANGRLRSRAWAFQMGRSQMTESGSRATPNKKKKNGPNLHESGYYGI